MLHSCPNKNNPKNPTGNVACREIAVCVLERRNRCIEYVVNRYSSFLFKYRNPKRIDWKRYMPRNCNLHTWKGNSRIEDFSCPNKVILECLRILPQISNHMKMKRWKKYMNPWVGNLTANIPPPKKETLEELCESASHLTKTLNNASVKCF